MQRPVAVITGAGRGIGRAIARELASAGVNLALVGRSCVNLGVVADECSAIDPDGNYMVFEADLRCSDSIPQLVNSCGEQMGGINFLVNNAGLFYRESSVSADVSRWDELIDLNIRAYMHMTRFVAPHIVSAVKNGDRGAIVFISSVSGKRTYAGGGAYSASKYATAGFSEAVFHDLRSQGIKVSCIFPDYVNTDLLVEAPNIDPDKAIKASDLAAVVKSICFWPASSCPTEIVLQPQFIPNRPI